MFHRDETKDVQLKCITRGNNAGNNIRWIHHGIDDSQVETKSADIGEKDGVPYAIWTTYITTSAKDAGMEEITCQWMQGDFPLTKDVKLLILRINSCTVVQDR